MQDTIKEKGLVMQKKQIDILITFYNQEKYVDSTIESVISQEVDADIRIIIGDDGSCDNTIERVKKWEYKYPDMISHYIMDRIPNKKYVSGFRASDNRLNLLKYVTGDYFIFLDGDDYFLTKEKLQRQLNILEKQENIDCIAAGHNIVALYEDGRTVELVPDIVKEGKYTAEMYWGELYFHTDTLLVRSSFIKSIPHKLSENQFNDNFITYLILQQGSIYYEPTADAVYRQTGTGIWTGNKLVVNNIRNMFLYDLCIAIDPKLKKLTMKRFYHTWKQLYIHRKEIHSEELKEFYEEAKSKKLSYSLLWINYESLPVLKKAMLIMMFAKIYVIHKLKG